MAFVEAGKSAYVWATKSFKPIAEFQPTVVFQAEVWQAYAAYATVQVEASRHAPSLDF